MRAVPDERHVPQGKFAVRVFQAIGDGYRKGVYLSEREAGAGGICLGS